MRVWDCESYMLVEVVNTNTSPTTICITTLISIFLSADVNEYDKEYTT